jgi:hypothetical protein
MPLGESKKKINGLGRDTPNVREREREREILIIILKHMYIHILSSHRIILSYLTLSEG